MKVRCRWIDRAAGCLTRKAVPAFLFGDFEVNASSQKVVRDPVNCSRLEVFLEFRASKDPHPGFCGQVSQPGPANTPTCAVASWSGSNSPC